MDVYTGAVNYTAQQPQLHLLKAVVENNVYIADTSVPFWYTEYLKYYEIHGEQEYLQEIAIASSISSGEVPLEAICNVSRLVVPPGIEWSVDTCMHLLKNNVTSLKVITSEEQFYNLLPEFLISPALIGDFSEAVQLCSTGDRKCIQVLG